MGRATVRAAGGISAVTTGGTLAPVLGSSTNSAGVLMGIAGNISNGIAIIQPNTGPSSGDTRLWMGAGSGATFRADGGIVMPDSMS